ncbi:MULTISPECIES: hypothetical protein [Sodalis]|jgi:hypothetical protein|uniref:Uncharacterized protein n=1 Tax=Sodalis ligni TaxID=2697027 RepID=A0A4R1NAE9_9GAMM|nr:hypothetical protein [Sodalis ligni]TCL02531.1 hypothetical protein EZJ58_0552 [Sodalis ligni]
MAKYQLDAGVQGESFCFDYTHYLSASCKKRWSFIDAIYGVMPIFGIVTKTPPVHSHTHQEQLKALALQVLSTQVNDETNIIRLIALAEQQGIFRFEIRLPYALEKGQLGAIQHEFGDHLSLQQHDERLSIQLTTIPEIPAA